MSTDEFTKLFTYMAERFDGLDKGLEAKAESADLHRALGLLDSLAKRVEVVEEELLVANFQLTKLHNWAELAAERLNLRLAN